jgi:ABC-2 type transport system ATP-binding protein
VELLLLGSVQASIANHSINLGVRKQRLVLAVLAMEVNRPVSVGRLVELIWQHDPPATARGMVHTYVCGLRTVLDNAGALRYGIWLDREVSGYVLRCDPEFIDIHRFRALTSEARRGDDDWRITLLERALDLWRGPALAGVAAEEVRLRLCRGLDEERCTAHEDLIDARLRLDRHNGLLAELLTLTDEHPNRPRLTGGLMRALHRAGRTAEALDTYQRARRRLREEFGLNPPRDLQDLHLAILHDDPALQPVTANLSPR